jgi:ELMO/CED-12 family
MENANIQDSASSLPSQSPIINSTKNINIEDEALINRPSKSKYNIDREPMTHLKNRNFIEKFFGSCFGDARLQLTYDELIGFYTLKEWANTFIDGKSTEYDDHFRKLYFNITKETLGEIVNDNWKNFGFQNANLRTDFRAGCLLSLKHLLYFTSNHGDRIAGMIEPSKDFLFGICSINVSYFLAKYYHLPDSLIFEKDKKEICSRVALKSFCQISEEDDNLHFKIHAMLLIDLFEIWIQIRNTVKGVNILDFGMALETMKKKFTNATRTELFDDYASFSSAYLNSAIELPTRRKSLMGSRLN